MVKNRLRLSPTDRAVSSISCKSPSSIRAYFGVAYWDCVAGGRAFRTYRRGLPAANGLNRIFGGIGNAGWRNVYPTDSISALWIVKLGNRDPHWIPSAPYRSQTAASR